MSERFFSAQPSDFPLRASLFWMDGKRVRSTWDYLARDKKHLVNKLVQKQTEYRSNCMTFLLFNMVDPNESPVNPFVGCPTAKQVMAGRNQVDWPEVERWRGLVDVGRVPGIYLIPCLFCGDDRGTTRNEAFHDYFLPAAVQFFRPYSRAFIISIEASKSMDVALQTRMIRRVKAAMPFDPCPVGVHNQGVRISPEADFLAYEFSWHPGDGDRQSVQAVVDEARRVMTQYPKWVWFQEMNLNPEGGRARAQARALRDMASRDPRIVGLPGPC